MVSKDTCRSRRVTERACSYLKNLKRRQLSIKMLVGTIEGGGLRIRTNQFGFDRKDP